ncbi:MAG: transglutaminaseTgpA domain-containing protein [Planctomycetaceae bacterium]
MTSPGKQRKSSDERLRSAFHRSIMLTACFSACILCGAEGALLPSGLTPVIAVVAWLFVEELKVFRLPILLANTLGIVALVAAAWEFVSGDIESKLLSGGHLIVYLTWIVLLLQKSMRQYWWTVTLCLLQLAVAAVLTSHSGFGSALIGMLFMLIWTLSLFSFYRVLRSEDTVEEATSDVRGNSATLAAGSGADSSGAAESLTGKPSSNASWRSGLRSWWSWLPWKKKSSRPSTAVARLIVVTDGLQRDTDEHWMSLRFRGMVFLSFLVSLCLSFIVFTAFPRMWVPGSPFTSGGHEEGPGRRGIFHRTGFTESVQLGEIGKLLTSNGRVFQFEIADARTNKPVNVDIFTAAMNLDEIRFRGNAMGTYKDGKWSRGLDERRVRFGERESPVSEKDMADYRVRVIQDPPVSQFAFAVFPIKNARAAPGSGSILQREVTGSLIWASGAAIDQNAPREFTFECDRALSAVKGGFEHWQVPSMLGEELRIRMLRYIDRYATHFFITDHLQRSVPRLYNIAHEICPTTNGMPLPEIDRVNRVMAYLSPENGFRYSLTLTREDQSIDPVEDFLMNTKAGHCEYFASACTLLLQSAGVPARLVNGFSGSELNSVTGRNEVKQHHSHTWVEAWVDGNWLTLDPVPASDRQQAVSSVQSRNLLTDLSTAFNDLWNGGIHNMTLERQKAFFNPVLELGTSVKDNVEKQGLWEATKAFFRHLFTSPRNLFSVSGGVVTFVLLLFGAGLYQLHPIRRLLSLLQMLRRRFSHEAVVTKSVIRFYERFQQLCTTYGITFTDSSTALENASSATRFLHSRLGESELVTVPMRIASAFNRVRFGHETLDEQSMSVIARELDALEQALRNSTTDHS